MTGRFPCPARPLRHPTIKRRGGNASGFVKIGIACLLVLPDFAFLLFGLVTIAEFFAEGLIVGGLPALPFQLPPMGW